MSKLAAPYNFNGYEITEIVPSLTKTFTTTFKTGDTTYRFVITEEIHKYMRNIQKKYCKSETDEFGPFLFTNKAYFLDREGNPLSNVFEGSVEIVLSTPRLIKKGEKFYPKFTVDPSICIL